jgi:alanyl-tRNA synthetase
MLSTSQIREKYLSFFESKGHLRFPSHPIPVYTDPTLMFSVAGMSQFKPQFVGAPARFAGVEGEWKRVTTAQKVIRIGDIENVGRTLRHCSFFEMMGNFSFDSYFKKEAIEWAWEFITSPDWLGFEADRIYVTIYKDDEEAFGYWTKNVGLDPSRINRFDADENFWPQNAPKKGPNGPCGPCSEIFYDRGEAFGSDTWEDYAKNPESDRFLEFWNLVFPGYNRSDGEDGKGALEDLGRQNIDTGLGLIRAALISQNVQDLYDTDDFRPLIAAVAKLSGKPYEGIKSVSHRVIAEHIRMVTMTLTDGLTFGTGEREYVVRKVMRRASRHAYLLGLKEPALYTLVPIVVQTLGTAFPELKAAADSVAKQIRLEESSFLETLGKGILRLEKLLETKKSGDVISGDDAFTLYDTYGFPLDLTKEIAEERNVGIDEDGYKAALKKAQALARGASKFKRGLFEGQNNLLENISSTDFVGYSSIQANAKVVALVAGDELVSNVTEGALVQIVLESTPFYAESGGQVGDTGMLHWVISTHQSGEIAVSNTFKTAQGVFVHEGTVLRGTLKQGDVVEARVETSARRATERHHTATHLLQAALRAVLGSSVNQAGSYVAPDRLRFDFTHAESMTDDEISKVEMLVNRWIQADFTVTSENMNLEAARKTGAMALFGEKYGDIVRVVSVNGDVSSIGILETVKRISSKELCGGTHVPSTGSIGSFVIISEESIKAGVRRIEALCGEAAVTYTRHALELLSKASRALTTTPENLTERLEKLFDEQKAAMREINNLKAAVVRAQTAGGANVDSLEINGFKAARLQLEGVEGGALKTAADDLMDKTKADIVVVGSGGGLVVKVSKEANAKGIKAGDIIRKLAQAGGGNGGGSPAMAQAGGIKDVAAALAALESVFN